MERRENWSYDNGRHSPDSICNADGDKVQEGNHLLEYRKFLRLHQDVSIPCFGSKPDLIASLGFGSRISLSMEDLFCKSHEIGRYVLRDHKMIAWVFFSEQETRWGESHAFSHEISPLNL